MMHEYLLVFIIYDVRVPDAAHSHGRGLTKTKLAADAVLFGLVFNGGHLWTINKYAVCHHLFKPMVVVDRSPKRCKNRKSGNKRLWKYNQFSPIAGSFFNSS